MKVDGSVDKYKARLVIHCFSQKEGIDLFDTYAPVARISTIRLLLALAAIHDLVIHQMDMITAFLNGDLDEKIYMKQPEGFVMPERESKLCKLKKSLYGLKQAPKQWHQKFDDVVLSNGFSLNQANKCVYSKFDASVSQLEYFRAIRCPMFAMISTRPDIAFVVGKLSRCDSVVPLAKAYSQVYNGKSRHLGVTHSMIRALIMNGVISVEFVRTQLNLADHLTKGLSRDLVRKAAIGMGLKST
nr:zinc finger, CCHC-type [Tanacetum cinerariifolium]